MNIKEITSKIDHTLLNVDSTWEQIKQICDDAIEYETASICIPAAYVKRVKAYVGDHMTVCTVIGFPSGYSTTAVKVFETQDAIENGADEIDMVINVGSLKDGNIEYVENEIKAVKSACGERLLKVIIEACLLTDDEKLTMCRIVTNAGADYIKTSTGFSKGGATFADVKLLAENIGHGVKVKASGGISTIAEAEEFIRLGSSRLGTSRIVKSLKAKKENP